MRVIGIMAVLLLTGCGGKDTATIETVDGTRVAVDTAGGGNVAEIRLTGADGNTATIVASESDGQVRVNIPGMSAAITTGGGWPPALATIAPAYPGAEITGSFGGVGQDGGGGTVTFTTADAPAKVVDFYKARAATAGLTATTGVQVVGQQMYTAADERTGRTLTVQAQVVDGTTQASVLYGTGRR